MMERTQAVNLPPWKLSVWFPVLKRFLTRMEHHFESRLNEFDPLLFPTLAKNWDSLTNDGDYGSFKGVKLDEGWLVTEQHKSDNDKVKETTYTWNARCEFLISKCLFLYSIKL